MFLFYKNRAYILFMITFNVKFLLNLLKVQGKMFYILTTQGDLIPLCSFLV